MGTNILLLLNVTHLKVTEDPAIVWNKALNDPGSLGEHQRDDLYTILVEHINRLNLIIRLLNL